jgi:N-acetylglucosaminyldiphosphoundecaprenol N-acetyl-beta-D-mannosaminyltransferase
MAEALARIAEFVASGEPHFVATADASMIVDANLDPTFGDLLRSADMVTPDSSGVLWAAKKLGQPLTEKVSGVDLVDRLCAQSAEKGYRIFFLGAGHGIAELAAEKMRLAHPGCNIVGARHGFFPADDDELVAREVAEANPDVLFVAMGIPRQEKFIARTRDIIRARVAIGVGGSLDVHSGRTKRAPVVFQKLKVEWLWRLFLNPSKWRKTMKLPKFMLMVLRSSR